MSPRELRLREQIDRLRDRIAVLEAVNAEMERALETRNRSPRPCSNCGKTCRGEMCGECRKFFQPYKRKCEVCGELCRGRRCRPCWQVAGKRQPCAECGRECRGLRCRECHVVWAGAA